MEQALTVDRVPEHIARAVVDPHAYAEFDSLHAKLAELRRDHPFARADLEGYPPFWIASKYKDIQEISRQNDLFRSRSEEHTSELQSLMRISYAVFCLKKKTYNYTLTQN